MNKKQLADEIKNDGMKSERTERKNYKIEEICTRAANDTKSNTHI